MAFAEEVSSDFIRNTPAVAQKGSSLFRSAKIPLTKTRNFLSPTGQKSKIRKGTQYAPNETPSWKFPLKKAAEEAKKKESDRSKQDESTKAKTAR